MCLLVAWFDNCQRDVIAKHHGCVLRPITVEPQSHHDGLPLSVACADSDGELVIARFNNVVARVRDRCDLKPKVCLGGPYRLHNRANVKQSA